MKIQSKSWWGAPRKFSTETIDRKVSWLELFYDLVYMIAIAKITHQFSENMNVSGFLDYLYFFIMIFSAGSMAVYITICTVRKVCAPG